MKKKDLVEGVVIRVDFPNKGIVETADGDIITVKNALLGQRISCVINKKRNGKYEGRLLEVIEKSSLELSESQCVHSGDCGGCLYQTFSYNDSIDIKEGQVRRLLEQSIGEDVFKDIYEGISSSPEIVGYRNKMEFSFGDEYMGGPLSLGMHKRGSFYDIVAVDSCQIMDEDFRLIVRTVLDYFRTLDISFYHKMKHVGYLRHLLVRKAKVTGEILIVLVTSTQCVKTDHTTDFDEDDVIDGFVDVLYKLETDGKLSGQIAGILHTKNDSLADVVKDDGTDILYGVDYIYEELLGLKFKISPFSFFQTNSLGAEVLYSKAREFITDSESLAGKVVYDLYSGTGTIAQILAADGGIDKVYGVEIVEEAVEAAKINASINGLSNCYFIAGDVLKALDDIEVLPDYIVVDPPRDGLHPKALKKIAGYGVKNILYISCKPTSLARDLVLLADEGYEPKRIATVDMFPWTGNIETVVLLSKGIIDSQKVKVEMSLEDMDMSGFRKGATYEAIKDYVKEQYGFKIPNLYIAQVKAKHGLEMRENFNLPKSENAKQPKCPPEKEKAIEEALRYFQMIL